MMISNTRFTPNLIWYYVLATLLFLVAISLHANVYRRFGAMQDGLREAARIKWTMEFDELKALAKYQKSVRLHRRGIRDTIAAFNCTAEVNSLREAVFEEEEDVLKLKQSAEKKKEEARADGRESAMHSMASFRDSRAFANSKVAGQNLAREAERENELSETIMNKTLEQEDAAKDRLKKAQATLELANAAQHHTEIDTGICKWAPAVCNLINSGSSAATVTDEAIQANKDIQEALLQIRNAEIERAKAIKLHNLASTHANLSTSMFADAEDFKTQSQEQWQEAKQSRSSAAKEESEAEKDMEDAKLEESDIATKEQEIRDDLNSSRIIFDRVVEDRRKESIAREQMTHYLKLVRERRTQWREKKTEATHHVARAGWEALLASVAASCLLVVVSSRILATFRYRQPLRWIVREMPYVPQDLLYLNCHAWIFLLAMGYGGELLTAFHDRGFVARAAITILIALVAAILQVTLLHLIPSVCALLRESRLDSGAIQPLVQEVVIKRGIIIALTSALELLLCWCWMGNIVFQRVHLFNTFVVWIAVLCMSTFYWIVVRREHVHTRIDALSRFSNSGLLVQGGSNGESERYSLLTASDLERSQGSSMSGYSEGSFYGATRKSLGTNLSSIGSPTSMQSIPIGRSTEPSEQEGDFGSLADMYQAQAFTTPWHSELEKVRLLFEIYIASVAIWIVCTDLSLVRKMSPLANDLVWGKLPLWIFNMFLFVVFFTLIVTFVHTKIGK
ncbi:unnamed protein product [Pseudo-nitzschia multistriata]|uniref:Uncharacterized protein n=1 Tax=Pseudo-nitzschia multistriata TaxID=183589 RepID=A0A448ZGH1_9STRA|nr:unnamed protein product [Pseudo-nitzschia multistriata]